MATPALVKKGSPSEVKTLKNSSGSLPAAKCRRMVRAETTRPRSTSIHQSFSGASAAGVQAVSTLPSISRAARFRAVPAARMPPPKVAAFCTASIFWRTNAGLSTPSAISTASPGSFHSPQPPGPPRRSSSAPKVWPASRSAPSIDKYVRIFAAKRLHIALNGL